jgi:hypothetical protein
MKSTDRFLIGIVVGIIILVAVAFGVALSKPEPAYQSDATPGGVVINYLTALRQEDYERAYAYLSPDILGYPKTLAAFRQVIRNYSYNPGLQNTASLEVISEKMEGSFGRVTVRETQFNPGGLFDSGEYQHTISFTVTQTPGTGEWKIETGEEYWGWCWNQAEGCK